MSKQTSSSIDRKWYSEGVISAISVGGIFVLIGVVFVINQNLIPQLEDFFSHFTMVKVGSSSVFLPAPLRPADHTYVYAAASQFALGVGILEILVLALRVSLGSRIRKTADTVGDLVFWFGAAYLLNNLASIKTTLSLIQQRETWFLFWAAIIMLIGFSLVARAIVLFAARHQMPKTEANKT